LECWVDFGDGLLFFGCVEGGLDFFQFFVCVFGVDGEFLQECRGFPDVDSGVPSVCSGCDEFFGFFQVWFFREILDFIDVRVVDCVPFRAEMYVAKICIWR